MNENYEDNDDHMDFDDYNYPQYTECGVCGMQVGENVKICPYCGAKKFTPAEWKKSQVSMALTFVAVMLLAAMAFCH